MSEIFLTREETAETLRLSLRTVDNLIVRGELAVRRVGRRVLIHTDEVRRFAEPKPPKPRIFEGETTPVMA
jgi:excisionase family DNA binding protein